MNDEDALRDVCKLQAFGGKDPNSPYHRSLQLKKHYVAAAMELRSCWALNAHNPESKHHSRYCAAWEAYLQASEESIDESLRRAEILEKAKQLREESRKEDNTRGLESNISEDDPMTVDNTTPVPEALDTADESPITTHAEIFKKNFVFGSRIESPKRCKSQDIAAISNPVDSSCHDSLHPLDEAIADGDTTPDRAV